LNLASLLPCCELMEISYTACCLFVELIILQTEHLQCHL
jgi:hypothetical protein